MLSDYKWTMEGWIQKYGLTSPAGELRQNEAERIFQIEPEPPKLDTLNSYILACLGERDLDYFSFFLHHYELILNKRIRKFLLNEGSFGYDPERFLDIKMACLVQMLRVLPLYDPDKGAEFTTFLYPFIRDAWLLFRMEEESLSIKSLSQYKSLRLAGQLSGEQNAAGQFAGRRKCSEETAQVYLRYAAYLRSRVPFYLTVQDEDSEETGEDVSRDDRWNYADIIEGDIRAKEVREAFAKLDYRERALLEGRCAINMTDGRVSPMKTRASFEMLATMFEGSDSSGAERAYRRAVDKLTRLLVETGTLHAAELRCKSIRRKNKKIAAAIYEYNADCDGDWGELSFDFLSDTAEVTRLAGGDTIKSSRYARAAIRTILSWTGDDLPKHWLAAMEREDSTPSREGRIRRQVEQGECHAVTIKPKGENSYLYLVDYDGAWGELRIDREANTGEVVKLAEWDTVKSHRFAKRAIRFLLQMEDGRLDEEVTLTVGR